MMTAISRQINEAKMSDSINSDHIFITQQICLIFQRTLK